MPSLAVTSNTLGQLKEIESLVSALIRFFPLLLALPLLFVFKGPILGI